MKPMEAIEHLAERIGPRGSCTPSEMEAVSWVEQQLGGLGLTAVSDSFRSATSQYRPYLWFALLALSGETLAWVGGKPGMIAAIVLLAIATVSLFLELTFRPNLLRWMSPRGSSQNLWTRIPASGEEKRQVVLLAHIDTHRTPWLFDKRLVKLLDPIVPLALLSCVVMLTMFSIHLASPGLLWLIITLPFALIVLFVLVLMAQADMTPYTRGANDNASGVGVLLGVVGRLSRSPLANTTVWVVFTGCEEVGCYGAEAFARKHRSDLERPFWIAIDSAGGKGANVTYIEKETFLATTRGDRQLVELAARVASESPELEVTPHHFKGGYTEAVIGDKYGFRVMSVGSYRRDGVLPEWHRPTDVVGNLDPQVVENAEAFVTRLMVGIDGL
jgi:hypothetical protein